MSLNRQIVILELVFFFFLSLFSAVLLRVSLLPHVLRKKKKKIGKQNIRDSRGLTSKMQELGKKHCFWVFGNKSRCLLVETKKTEADICQKSDSWWTVNYLGIICLLPGMHTFVKLLTLAVWIKVIYVEQNEFQRPGRFPL